MKLSKEDQKALDQATSEYKEFVQGQIDQLLKDTEEFQRVLKSGDLEEAKKVYPLIRMSYERSEPIAESFGESDVKIDFRLVDYVERKQIRRRLVWFPPYRTNLVGRKYNRRHCKICRAIGK